MPSLATLPASRTAVTTAEVSTSPVGMLRKQLTLVLCWNSGSERSVFVIWRAKAGL